MVCSLLRRMRPTDTHVERLNVVDTLLDDGVAASVNESWLNLDCEGCAEFLLEIFLVLSSLGVVDAELVDLLDL